MTFPYDKKLTTFLVFSLALLVAGPGCSGEEGSDSDTPTTVEDTATTPDPDVEAVDDPIEETVSDLGDASDAAEVDQTDETDADEPDTPEDTEVEVSDADALDESSDDGPADVEEEDVAIDVEVEPTFDVTFGEIVDSGPPPACDPEDITDICTSVCRGLELCSGGGGEGCIAGCQENLGDCTEDEFTTICGCISTHLTCRTYSDWSNCMGEAACVL